MGIEEGTNTDINKFFEGKVISEIRVGQSGANVYEIDGNLILKHVQREKLKNDLFDTYTKEALFYQSKMVETAEYLPEVTDVEISDDEIVMVMKKYKCLDRSDYDGKIGKIIRTLASIHSDEIPEFLLSEEKKNELLSPERTDYCLKDWQGVLSEHKGAFDETLLKPVSERINELIEWNNSEDSVLTHGDYHWENLLEDEVSRIVVCDWQGVGIGGASGDLSFFISRLGADGIDADSELILKEYADAIRDISGKTVDTEDIKKHMAAANVITSFLFWHEFLHGNDECRVRGVFDKMISDFRVWDK